MRVKVFFIDMKHALVGRKKSAKISTRIQWFFNCSNTAVHCNCNITVLLGRELRTPSRLVFWEFMKYLRKIYEGHSKDTRRKLGTRALKGHSKGTWAMGHSRHLDLWALRHLSTWRALGHLRTLALGHSTSSRHFN